MDFDANCNGSVDSSTTCYLHVGCFLRYSIPWILGYSLAYSFVFLVGLLGNFVVLSVITRSFSMRTPFHLLLANLAVADLMVILFCIPVTLVGHIFGAWILGLFVCKTVTYLQGVSVCASVNTLVAISVDRFLAICYPMKWQITSRGCRLIIAAIWAFSLTITLPWTLFFQLTPMFPEGGDPSLQLCQEVWPTKKMGIIYFMVANLVLCYLLPLAIITMCYIFIWLRVWRRKLPGEGQDRGSENMVQRSKIKVVKMLLVVVIVFALSWLPLYTIFAFVKMGSPYEEGSMEETIIQVVAPVAQWLGASNSCINPILYAFFNSKFRAGFKAILLSRKCCGQVTFRDVVNEKTRTMRSTSTLQKKRADGEWHTDLRHCTIRSSELQKSLKL